MCGAVNTSINFTFETHLTVTLVSLFRKSMSLLQKRLNEANFRLIYHSL